MRFMTYNMFRNNMRRQNLKTRRQNILIIGYTTVGNYIYIDPNDNENFYICSEEYLKSNNSYKYSFEIRINK